MADIEYKTPQDVAEEKSLAATDKAYRRSLRMTEESPKETPKKDARDLVRGQRGYANGGSASSRADGCALRGKTKGRMI